MIADSLGAASRIVMSVRIRSMACFPSINCHPLQSEDLQLTPNQRCCVSQALKMYNKTLQRLLVFMYEVTVEDTFAAGHYLRNYKGKCENPHGHNYKIRVTLAGAELDKAGLLLDFKDLKEVMKQTIDRLDHQMINDIEPFTVLNPSAENHT